MITVACGMDREERQVWAAINRRAINELLTTEEDLVDRDWLDCALIGSRSVANGGRDQGVLAFELDVASRVTEQDEYDDTINDIACALVGGRPVVFTGSVDGRVRVWDLLTRRCLETLVLPGACTSLGAGADYLVAAFGPDIAVFTQLR